ncbi:MAG TPA: tetratricopeptide repeat protein [Thermodesulfobacteriota bacterium]|nr:tetratricopeptide repeat protein [Thermodesulfobacteriota bacterium]
MSRILPLILTLLIGIPGAWGQEQGRVYVDEALQMGLGDRFLEEKDFYRAITEYKRFLFFFPDSPRAEEALWKIAVAYFDGKRWGEAISAADDLLKKFPSSLWAAEAVFLKGRAASEQKDYSQARAFFRTAERMAPGKPLAEEAQWQLALTYIREERWKDAAAELRRVNPESRLYPKADLLARGLDKMQDVPQKSPVAAGVLAAVLPGAGHFYSERYRDAAVAFALNGAFIAGIVESFEHGNYVVGGILTFFELGWYSGNIYSAVSSAHKYNRDKKKDYMERLQREGDFSVGVSYHGHAPVLALRYVF